MLDSGKFTICFFMRSFLSLINLEFYYEENQDEDQYDHRQKDSCWKVTKRKPGAKYTSSESWNAEV